MSASTPSVMRHRALRSSLFSIFLPFYKISYIRHNTRLTSAPLVLFFVRRIDRNLTFEVRGGRQAVPLTEGLGGGAFECGTATMMPPTSPPPVAKREVVADEGGGAVVLTNICLRLRLSASAGLVVGLGLLRVWREPAEAAEPSEVNETSFQASALDDEAAKRPLPG